MTVLTHQQTATKDSILLVLVTLVPLAAIMGNAVGDIALVALTLTFIVTSPHEWRIFVHSRFLWLFFLFWIWILLCSGLSLFPRHSFQDSLPYIRFPLYAFALSHLLMRAEGKFLRYFMLASIAGTLIEFAFMMREYLFMRDETYARLHGTFGKLIPGWYLSSFGLLALLWGVETLKARPSSLKHKIFLVIFGAIVTFGVIISGEIMSTLFFLGTAALYAFCQFGSTKRTIGTLVIGAIALVLLWLILGIMDPQLHARIVDSFSRRLPWMPSSDYHLPWSLGLEMALHNPLLGVGPKNFNVYCTSLADAGTLQAVLGESRCHWHAHNLYLSIAAETGTPGLVIFSLLAIYVLILAYRHARASAWADMLPLILAFVLFFPVQTYSQAFGQSKNFYFFTMLGYALFLIRGGLQKQTIDNRI